MTKRRPRRSEDVAAKAKVKKKKLRKRQAGRGREYIYIFVVGSFVRSCVQCAEWRSCGAFSPPPTSTVLEHWGVATGVVAMPLVVITSLHFFLPFFLSFLSSFWCLCRKRRRRRNRPVPLLLLLLLFLNGLLINKKRAKTTAAGKMYHLRPLVRYCAFPSDSLNYSSVNASSSSAFLFLFLSSSPFLPFLHRRRRLYLSSQFSIQKSCAVCVGVRRDTRTYISCCCCCCFSIDWSNLVGRVVPCRAVVRQE